MFTARRNNCQARDHCSRQCLNICTYPAVLLQLGEMATKPETTVCDSVITFLSMKPLDIIKGDIGTFPTMFLQLGETTVKPETVIQDSVQRL